MPSGQRTNSSQGTSFSARRAAGGWGRLPPTSAAVPWWSAVRPPTIHLLLWPTIVVWLFVLWFSGRDVGFLADDHDFLGVAAAMDSPWQAFERGHTAPKPIHHLVFWWGAHCTGPDPAWMRLPAFLAEAVLLGFVFRIARQAGAGTGGAALATLLFASFATTRSLLWPVAISGFLRVTFALMALSFWIDAQRSRWAAVAAVLATMLAMGAHQSGALTPGLFVLWSAFQGGGSLRDHVARGVRAARHPVVLLAVAVVALYVVWASGSEDPYRGIRELGAIAANTLRGIVALAPDEVRIAAIAAARGQVSGAMWFVGWAAVALCCACHCLLFVRGSGFWRFAIVAGACDMALAVVTAGWTQRYCYLAASLLAVAVGASFSLAGSRRRRIGIALVAGLLMACWGRESLRVAAEIRDASAVAEGLFDFAIETERDLGDDTVLVVANAPDVWGRERDLAMLNWGLEPALRTRGMKREFRQVRTTPARTSTAMSLVSAADLETLRLDPAGSLVEFVPAERSIVRWKGGVKIAERRL